MKARLLSGKEILKDSCGGALFGLGISLFFLVVTQGIYAPFWAWLASLFFGLVLGFFITIAIENINNLFVAVFPYHSVGFLFRFILSFSVGFGLFWILAQAFWPFNFTGRSLLAFSLATGFFSALVGLFFAYSWGAKERLRLEEENKKLAVPEERNRIALQLHDSIVQSLFGLNLHLNTLVYLHEHRPEEVQGVICQLQNKVEEIHKELKLMIHELKPAVFIGTDFQKPVESVAPKTEGWEDNR